MLKVVKENNDFVSKTMRQFKYRNPTVTKKFDFGNISKFLIIKSVQRKCKSTGGNL